MEPVLLIAWYSVTGVNAQLAQAAWRGARDQSGVRCMRRAALRCSLEEFAAASGYVFVGPENFGQLAGGLRMLFERAFYPLEHDLAGRPYATMVGCGNDGRGATRDIDRICAGWRLKRVAEPLIAHGPLAESDLRAAREMGASLAAGLAAGVF